MGRERRFGSSSWGRFTQAGQPPGHMAVVKNLFSLTAQRSDFPEHLGAGEESFADPQHPLKSQEW